MFHLGLRFRCSPQNIAIANDPLFLSIWSFLVFFLVYPISSWHETPPPPQHTHTHTFPGLSGSKSCNRHRYILLLYPRTSSPHPIPQGINVWVQNGGSGYYQDSCLVTNFFLSLLLRFQRFRPHSTDKKVELQTISSPLLLVGVDLVIVSTE